MINQVVSFYLNPNPVKEICQPVKEWK